MSRGDRGERIFLDDVDRHDFIKTLAEACQKADWQIHAFCLTSDHYHPVLETPNADLVSGMTWLQSTYTIRLNNRHKLAGHVLSGPYKAQLVDGSATGCLRMERESSQRNWRACNGRRAIWPPGRRAIR
jgi:REP element-mobilizing transposase RayT